MDGRENAPVASWYGDMHAHISSKHARVVQLVVFNMLVTLLEKKLFEVQDSTLQLVIRDMHSSCWAAAVAASCCVLTACSTLHAQQLQKQVCSRKKQVCL
jgi:hypothetical protein